MFTIEIGGKPIAVVDAPETDVRELLDQDDFMEDLSSLTTEGKPLWDGRAALTIRPSTPDEVAEYEDSAFDDEDEDEEEDDEESSTVYFLVPLDDEEDDDEELNS
jgi:hypothetical protein